jgi:hypothetical protein
MAVRENQGLQIALIVFVMLTIMLSVSTFLFFRNYQSEQQRAKTAEDNTAKATQSLTVLQGERDSFIQIIGFPANEKKETVEETYGKDLAAVAALGLTNLPDDQKNYRKILENLEALAKSQHTQMAKKDEDLRAANDTLALKTKEYDDEKAKIVKEKDDAITEYKAERDRIAKQNGELVVTKNQLMAAKEAKDKELDDLKAKSDTQINTLKDNLTSANQSIARLKTQNSEITAQYNVNAAPDGRIVWVSQREGTAVINLGSADNLRKRITFSVYDPSTTDVSAFKSEKDEKAATPASVAVSKGSIEVINITDSHMAECRILQHSPSNPILPGDSIYTPAWQPGQQDHFALAGLLDVDGDGVDDGQRVRELIQLNGGAIDNEVSVNTRYLVVGKIDAAADDVANSNKLLGDAKTYGIQHIKLGQLLEMMGYSAKAAEGVIAPGEGLRHPQPGEPTGKFRPRNPPPRGKIGSAY